MPPAPAITVVTMGLLGTTALPGVVGLTMRRGEASPAPTDTGACACCTIVRGECGCGGPSCRCCGEPGGGAPGVGVAPRTPPPPLRTGTGETARWICPGGEGPRAERGCAVGCGAMGCLQTRALCGVFARGAVCAVVRGVLGAALVASRGLVATLGDTCGVPARLPRHRMLVAELPAGVVALGMSPLPLSEMLRTVLSRRLPLPTSVLPDEFLTGAVAC